MGAQNTRIDLLNAGAKSNSVKLVSHKADRAELLSPNWFKKANDMGKVLQFKMKKRWQHYEVTLQAIGDGTLNIQFKGKDRRHNTIAASCFLLTLRCRLYGTKINS